MKCNIKKLNNFFENEQVDDDIKKFVKKLLNLRAKETGTYIDGYLFGLGFYESESEFLEYYNEEDLLINFNKINKLNETIRKIEFKNIIKGVKQEKEFNEDSDDLFFDLSIFINYEDWVKNQRKYKLQELNNYND